MRILSAVVLSLSIIALVGCGPMGSGPMPPRLDAEQQKKVDEAWENALNPVNNLDRQATLDALIVAQAYQAGVDKLEFRSEKKFSGGIIVMEIHFDRAKPDNDRFIVSIRDAGGGEVRRLEYNRTEVETTYRDLNDRRWTDPNVPPPADPDQIKKRDEVRKRVAAVEKLFPVPEEEKGRK